MKKNININLIKIFLNYSKIILLRQRINVLNLAITEKRLKALTSLIMSNTFAKLKIYFELTKYIKQYIHFYASISRSLQNLKTSFIKKESKNEKKKSRIHRK